MIGTKLKSGTTLTGATIIWASLSVAALVMAVISIQDEIAPSLFLLALLPICVTIAFWTNRRKPFQAELQEEMLVTNVPGHDQVHYSTIMAVQAEAPHQRHYPLHLHYGRGVLSIPVRVGVPAVELQRFFSGMIPQNKYAAVTGELQAICQKQIDKFGAEKVFVFTPRLDVAKGFRGTTGRAFALGLVFTGLLWIIGGPIAGINQRHFDGAAWSVAGLLIAVFGSILAIFFSSQRRLGGGEEKWKQSGMVISPVGLAIIQGKLRGEMKWGELKRLVFPIKRTSFDSSTRHGSIRLDFGGDSVEIFDIYCHPLEVVHERIKGYWQG